MKSLLVLLALLIPSLSFAEVHYISIGKEVRGACPCGDTCPHGDLCTCGVHCNCALTKRIDDLEASSKGNTSSLNEIVTRLASIEQLILKPQAATPKAQAVPPQTKARMGFYPSNGPEWSNPGNIDSHLRNAHNAERRFDPTWFNSLSYEQKKELHDDIHEWEEDRNSAAKARLDSYAIYAKSAGTQTVSKPYKVQSQSRSACPGGVCPGTTSSSRFRVFGRR